MIDSLTTKLASLGMILIFLSSCQDPSSGSNTKPKSVVPTEVLETNQNGWVSSGGDLFKTARNPWFLKNVESISYCIDYDPAGLSVGIEDIRVEIKNAFEYWKNEFNYAEEFLSASNDKTPGRTELATQLVNESSCDGKEDIQFIFGASKLSAGQKTYLQKPTEHLGVTVRTQYDPVQMRGKGFIYIAADQGPFRFNAENDFTQTLWSEPLTLRAMLTHELGHVYGFSHHGSLIMSEGFAERLVTMAGFAALRGLKQLPSFLRAPESSQSCFNDSTVFDWFGYQVDREQFDKVGLSNRWCIELDLLEQSTIAQTEYKINWRVSVTDTDTNENVTLGHLEMADPKLVDKSFPWPMDFELRNAGIIFLTPEQKVFGKDDLITVPVPDLQNPQEVHQRTFQYLFSASPTSHSLPAQYQPVRGEVRSVYVHSAPEGYKIIGEHEGQQKLLFNSTTMQFF